MDYFNPSPVTGPSQASFDALQATLNGILPLGPFTVATLPVPDASLLYRLATVTDVFGNRATRMRCEKVAVGGVDYFYWQPPSSDSSGTIDVSSLNQIVPALTTPTTINLSGSVAAGVARQVTLQDGAYPGQTKEFRMDGALGLGSTLNLLGTGLGSGLSLILGGYAKYASDWTTTPGSRIWKRLL